MEAGRNVCLLFAAKLCFTFAVPQFSTPSLLDFGQTTMDIDLTGRIRNTKLANHHALFPVFEAIVNSIHAMPDGHSGSIEISVERDHSQGQLEEVGALYPVRSFTVSDNGVGFTQENYDSFSTADSRFKVKIGGKGVGRFLWLKAFDHAEIESTFQDADGKWGYRRFDLKLTPSGVENHDLQKATTTERKTVVRLVDMKSQYQNHVQRSLSAIANRIVEHCLEHFVLGLAPKITIVDGDTSEKIDLGELYNTEVKVQTEAPPFEISGRKFNIHNLRVGLTYDNTHRLYFCANKRAVVSEKLDGRVPNLAGTLKDGDGKPFVYAGYVSGEYLDEMVNTERTGFSLPEEPSMFGDITWPKLVTTVSGEASQFLQPYTQPVKQDKEQRIRTFVQTKAPHYRPLLKHKTAVMDVIPPHLSDEKLDLELYRLNQDYDADLREQGGKLLESIESGDDKDVAEGYKQFLEEWNEAGMAKLATHVAHRKATLKLLRASLSLTEKGKYKLESAVHGLIFPLRKTSDDVRADQMNLWIIDDKLAYHYYLASDIPFNQLQEDTVKVDSPDRPDVLIFNRPAAFVNQGAPFNSVVLIEFKRPARDNYTDDENPIAQVYRYVSQIKSGKALDRSGRPIAVPPQLPCYAYIIADLTETLKFQSNAAGYLPSPDGLGYFGYNSQFGVYVEVISFDKLVSDAERRNSYFFNQLGLL